MPRVQRLLAAAARKEIDGGLVPIENFDETLRDLMRLLPDLDTTVLDEIASERRVWSPATRPTGNRGYPVVRLNALELTGTPTVCRRAVCDAGGVAEVRSAIEASGLPVIGTRSKAGVLAFGADADVRAVLSAYEIESFDLHPIEARRLRYDSHERGLLRDLAIIMLNDHRFWGHASGPLLSGKRLPSRHPLLARPCRSPQRPTARAVFGPPAMSDLSPRRAIKRTSVNAMNL